MNAKLQKTDLVLFDQYDKEYKIGLTNDTVVLCVFKANKKIGSEGVRWTRAFYNNLPSDIVFYPVLEFKRAYRALPLFVKKHITKHHLQGEFYNPAITDKLPNERHPALILDWKNNIADLIMREEEDVLVLKLVDGNIVKSEKGDFSTEKFNDFFN